VAEHVGGDIYGYHMAARTDALRDHQRLVSSPRRHFEHAITGSKIRELEQHLSCRAGAFLTSLAFTLPGIGSVTA